MILIFNPLIWKFWLHKQHNLTIIANTDCFNTIHRNICKLLNLALAGFDQRLPVSSSRDRNNISVLIDEVIFEVYMLGIIRNISVSDGIKRPYMRRVQV